MKEKRKPMRIFWMTLGLLCLGLGTLGVILPVLPTVPFYMATLCCFARSSTRLHNWFKGTGLYKKHLESYVENRAMTVRTKVGILFWVTVLMGSGFILMAQVPVARAALAVVWICHLIFLLAKVRTIPAQTLLSEED